MSRGFGRLSADKHTVFPCRQGVRDGTSDFVSPTPLEVAIPWWGKVHQFQISVTWHINPATSVTGASQYSRQITCVRPLPLDIKEWMTFFPGVYRDAVLGLSGPYNGTESPFSVFHWEGQVISTGIDDVFQSTSLEAHLRLFWDGYKTPSTDGSVADGFVRPSIQLRILMTYDDGNEGSLYIQTAPASWDLTDPPTAGPPFQTSGTAEIDGISFFVVAADDVDHDTFHQSPPEVVITPIEFYPWAKLDGTLPMWDTATGALMPGRNPLETAM